MILYIKTMKFNPKFNKFEWVESNFIQTQKIIILNNLIGLSQFH